jgi:hypothetical protein
MAPLLKLVREASYNLSDGRSVWYDNGDALQDAADLYAVLSELHKTGSPNLENKQAENILGRLQQGIGLGAMHIGTLRKLLEKHAAAIAAYRNSPDRDGQDVLGMASAGADARIIDKRKAV